MAAIAAEADLEANPAPNPGTGSAVDPETFPDEVILEMPPEGLTPDMLPEDVTPDVSPDEVSPDTVVPDENPEVPPEAKSDDSSEVSLEVPPEVEVRVDRSPLVDDARSSTIKKQSTVMVATYPQ